MLGLLAGENLDGGVWRGLLARMQSFGGRCIQSLVAAPVGGQGERAQVTLPMSASDRITTDPARCGGRPCIRDLRVPVQDVLDLLAAGASREEILADYPYLEDEDITAALELAALKGRSSAAEPSRAEGARR